MDTTETPRLIERAAEWLAALDAGSADPEAFAAWRDADLAHAAAFAQVAAAWERMGTARFVADDRSAPVTRSAPAPDIGRRRFATAASVALALGASGLFGTRLWARSSAETGVGERRTIVIAEGARLELNTDSAVEWRAGERTQIWLERGQAALDVAPASAGLLLHGGGVAARLRPGRYDVRLDGGALNVLVLEGRSDSAAGSASAAAGARLRLAPERTTVEPAAEVERERALAWRRGELVFAGDALGDAVREYNRYLTRKLVVRDPGVAALQLGGRFISDDPAAFLAALRATFGVVALDRGKVVLLVAPVRK